MKTRKGLLSCAVAVGMVVGLVSCARLTLQEGPNEVADGTTVGGYPNVQATINVSLDKALAVVDAAAARNAERDSRYATLSRTLQRERDGNWATERVLDPNSSDEVTDEEYVEIASLIADDPELDADLGKLADELAAVYAAIPPIEIEVQDHGEKDNPIGKPYVIRSKDGVIDFGYQRLTVEEFLLWIQSQETRPGRGFIFESRYEGGGRLWPADMVRYFFDSTISSSDRTWMWWMLRRTHLATGIRFREYAYTESRRYAWERMSRSYLRISTEELGDDRGRATIGQTRKSYLKIDDDLSRDDSGEPTFYHEVGHVLGLLHEHQREDRGSYVYVSETGSAYDRIYVWRNQTFWFLWWSWTSAVRNATTYDTPYDYHSVMHYPSAANSITLRDSVARQHNNGANTWTVRDENRRVWGAENRYTYFTPWDIYTIRRRYGISPYIRPTYTPKPTYPS